MKENKLERTVCLYNKMKFAEWGISPKSNKYCKVGSHKACEYCTKHYPKLYGVNK